MIVVGIVEPTGRRVITYGGRSRGVATPLDGATVFELASLTKAFTSLLLADAVTRGEIALNNPRRSFFRRRSNAGAGSTFNHLARSDDAHIGDAAEGRYEFAPNVVSTITQRTRGSLRSCPVSPRLIFAFSTLQFFYGWPQSHSLP